MFYGVKNRSKKQKAQKASFSLREKGRKSRKFFLTQVLAAQGLLTKNCDF
jgi:hypothetical protein